jgi:hypothetical protein
LTDNLGRLRKAAQKLCRDKNNKSARLMRRDRE